MNLWKLLFVALLLSSIGCSIPGYPSVQNISNFAQKEIHRAAAPDEELPAPLPTPPDLPRKEPTLLPLPLLLESSNTTSDKLGNSLPEKQSANVNNSSEDESPFETILNRVLWPTPHVPEAPPEKKKLVGNLTSNLANTTAPPATDDELKEKKDDDKKDDDKKDDDKKDDKPKWYSAHGQATVIPQGNWMFRSPYQGKESFQNIQDLRTSETSTLYLDTKLWRGAEFIFNPEVAGGYGLSFTNGIAGFPNGEITRVGLPQPTIYFARALLKQTIAIGDETEKVIDGPNQIAGERAVERFTFTLGKMAFIDQFDDNRYTHDPRVQFMNWALMYNGAWDYPANVRGYTYGGTLEYNSEKWAVRYGIMQEPLVANGAPLDPHILKAQGQALEFEYRYDIWNRPGAVRLLSYLNHANMGSYRLALLESPVNPDITTTRSYRFKYGFGFSGNQELTDDLGMFMRLGWNDGHSESWAFTEIDRTMSIGLSLKGTQWGRPQDTFGLAVLANGLSRDHRAYLAAGGYGFIVGDGKLNYGLEETLETYYSIQLATGIFLTLDFQEVNNPGYNRDRGPVSIMGARAHFEF